MGATKRLTANGSNGKHQFALQVNENRTENNSSFMGFELILSPLQTGWDWNWSGQPNRISFSVRIGDNTFNGNIPIYDGRSTVVVASGFDIEIPHNDDGSKTIDISFTVTDTTGANYTCGNASASSTLQLTQLHQPPEITDATLVENNTILTNLQVPNNTIVQYLSNKTLTVTAVYDDSEIDTCSVYHNNVLIGTSNTNEVALNFANVGELITTETNGTHYVGLNVAVKDKKNGYSTRMFNFSVIKYTRPTIEATSTNIKRKTSGGTALTANIVLLNFVGTCYKGNDVIGNANNPTVKYKIWNGTEPNYSELTVSNTANVVVRDFEIHDIEYTKTYQYKIKINDVFTNLIDNPIEKVDKVSTGVSVWSEYKDRVNFIKVTINDKQIFAPYELYESDLQSDEVEIFGEETNDSIENYKYIEIHSRISDGFDLPIIRIYEPLNKQFSIPCIRWDVGVFVCSANYSISNKKINLTSTTALYVNSASQIGYVRQNQDNYRFIITKVIGYK